jgi:hypothetical protein
MTTVSPGFIQRLPTSVRGESAVVKVVPMTKEHVRYWHNHVQPVINRHYKKAKKAPSGGASDDKNIRADVGWNWNVYFFLMLFHNTMTHVPGNASGRARGLAVVVEAENAKEIPVGMLTVVPKFSTTVQGERRLRTFAWYLSDAPAEVYDELDLAPLRSMAKALLDTALQVGWSEQMDGEFLLHADPAGGKKLKEFYREKCKMTPVTPAPVSLVRWRPVEGYFYFTAPESKEFSAQLDKFR